MYFATCWRWSQLRSCAVAIAVTERGGVGLTETETTCVKRHHPGIPGRVASQCKAMDAARDVLGCKLEGCIKIPAF